jgi:pimeloyl-ACP methyl ester carboxylesterase
MYFHGTPSSRLEPLLIGDDTLRNLGLRVVAPDRPGMGRSDFQPKRRFLDWPADVVELADSLGIERFAILASSGGAGYAAACAATIPERISAVVIVSGGWRMDSTLARRTLRFPYSLPWLLARRAPLLLPLMLKAMSGFGGTRDQQLARMGRGLRAIEVAALRKPGRLEALVIATRESMRQGTHGPALDMRHYVRDFGFQLGAIRIPLQLFHGEQDRNVPITLVRHMLTLIPDSRLTAFPEDAHFSTLINHADEIAKILLGSN